MNAISRIGFKPSPHLWRSIGTVEHTSNAQAAAIVEWARRFDTAHIEYWLFGGWAVDYHAGRVTRSHDDLDFVIWARTIAATLAFVRADIEFEITLIDRAADGAIVTPGFKKWPWDAGTFGNDIQALDGYPVRVVSIAGLLAVKDRVGIAAGIDPTISLTLTSCGSRSPRTDRADHSPLPRCRALRSERIQQFWADPRGADTGHSAERSLSPISSAVQGNRGVPSMDSPGIWQRCSLGF